MKGTQLGTGAAWPEEWVLKKRLTQDWRDTDPAGRKRQRGNMGRREQAGEKRVRHFTREPEEGRRVSPRFADERAEVATAGDEGRARVDETENAG